VEDDISRREVDEAIEIATERAAEVQDSFAAALEDGSVREDLATEVNRRTEDLHELADEARERADPSHE
jgi:hypothetical protein